MDLREQLEYPLPALSVDIEKILLEMSASLDGSFQIKNTGGGLLEGRVIFDRRLIQFSPEQFEGNAVKMTYRVPSSIELADEEIRTDAVVFTNGGEKKIPVHIVFRAKAILTKNNTAIADLHDFAAYSQANFESAAELMRLASFRAMLLRSRFAYIEAYENLLKDRNHERALESFLVLTGIKKPVKISAGQTRFTFKFKPTEKEIQYGQIPVSRSGWGYIDSTAVVMGATPWLQVLTPLAQALKGVEQGNISFSVDPAFLSQHYGLGTIQAADDQIIVMAVKEPYIRVKPSKEIYRPEEQGKICIRNQTGGDLMVKIQVRDSFLRFEAQEFLIAEYAEIPFQIKLSVMQSLAFRRQPVLTAYVDVRTSWAVRRVKIRVGEF